MWGLCGDELRVCEITPKVGGNKTRRKRGRDECSFAVSNSIIVGDRAEEEHENACLDLFKEKISPYELWILDWEKKNTQTVRGNQSMTTET